MEHSVLINLVLYLLQYHMAYCYCADKFCLNIIEGEVPTQLGLAGELTLYNSWAITPDRSPSIVIHN